MSGADDIKKLFNRQLKEAASGTFDADVREVNESERTCKVEVGGVKYKDVSLYAVKDENLKGFCFIPKINSKVQVSRIGGSNMLYVSMFSAVEKVILTINDEERDKAA